MFPDQEMVHITSIEQLQDEVTNKEFELAIVDKNLIFSEKAIEIFQNRRIKGLLFNGDYEELQLKMLPFVEEDRRNKENEVEPKEKVIVVTKEVETDERQQVIPIVKEIVREKEVEVIKERYSSLATISVGVINLNAKAGATFIALNLAKIIAEKNFSTTIIQTPKGDLYKRLGLFQKINNFNSFHHNIFEGKKGKESDIDRNIYEGISFIVPNDTYEITDWSSNDMLKLFYIPVKNSVMSIVDLGKEYAAEYAADVIEELDYIIAVIDGAEEIKLSDIRKLKQTNIPIIYVINNISKKEGDKCIEEYSLPKENTIIIPTYITKGEFLNKEDKEDFRRRFKVIFQLLPQEVEVPVQQQKQVVTQYVNLGNKLIGVLGTTVGVGSTHTAISIANSLAKEFSVAVVEPYENGTFYRLHEMLEERVRGKHFEYLGVDYYHQHLDEFLIAHKQEYTFIIVDFGSWEEIEIDEFLKCDKQYIVAHGIDWKIHELHEFEKATAGYKKSNWVYIFPFMKERKNIDFKTNQPVIPVGVNNPFKPNMETIRIYYQTLGLREKQKGKSQIEIKRIVAMVVNMIKKIKKRKDEKNGVNEVS